jgi:hypothetical protein
MPRYDERAGYTKYILPPEKRSGASKETGIRFDPQLLASIAEQYVQAPVCTQAEVKEEIKSMTSLVQHEGRIPEVQS